MAGKSVTSEAPLKQLPSVEKLDWHFPTDAVTELREFLVSGRWRAKAVSVKGNQRRHVFYVPPALPHEAFFVKHDHPRSPADCAKSLLRCKSRIEFEAYRKLSEFNIPAPECRGWASAGADSLLVTSAVTSCKPFPEAWEKLSNNPEARIQLISELSCLFKDLTTNELFHPDFHAGNVVVQSQSEKVNLFLIDPYGLRQKRYISQREKFKMLAWLTAYASELAVSEIEQLLTAADCLESKGSKTTREVKSAWTALILFSVHQGNARWKGRKKRLLNQGSLCTQAQIRGRKYLLMNEFPLEVAELALAQHAEQVSLPNGLLKNGRKRRLSLVNLKNASYVVKEFRRPRRLLPADKAAWLNTNRLVWQGISAARPLAWIRGARKAYILFENAGPKNLPEVLRDDKTPTVRSHMLSLAAQLIARLHTQRIFHRDLKATNFVAGKLDGKLREINLKLVDCDAVRFDIRITTERRLRNLTQFLNVVHRFTTGAERRAFWNEYAAEELLSEKFKKKCEAKLNGVL